MKIEIIILRLVLAVVVGGIIGYERSSSNSPAGLRTHILVCISTTMVSLIQITMVNEAMTLAASDERFVEMMKLDYSRLGAQALAGIGFLGAGTILHSKGNIVGLTTAASIWAVAIVGLALGMGYYVVAIFGGLGIVLTLDGMNKFQKKYLLKPYEVQLDIFHYRDDLELVASINTYLLKHKIKINKVQVEEIEENEMYHIKYNVIMPKNIDLDKIKHDLYTMNENITNVTSYGIK